MDDGDWVLIEQTPDFRRWELDIGNNQVVRRTEYLMDEDLFEANMRQLNDSDGDRWGDGKVVASIPMNEFFKKLGPAVKAGDREYVKKFLNDGDNRRYRRFKGQV